MPKNGTVIDKDTGLKAFLKKLQSLPLVSSVTVGIIEGSPKAQFRYGNLQKFRPETADLLLRTTVDNKKSEIQQKLLAISRRVLLNNTDMTTELKKLGAEIKQNMDDQTDNPPQLRTSIIVKVDA